MVSITIPFFYGNEIIPGGGGFFGGSVADPRRLPLTVSLAGQQYPIDLREYRHNGVARFRQGVVTSGEPNDQLLSSEGAWWRYRFSWHLGAGQEIDELDPESDSARFFESRGIDVWDKYKMCLLPKVNNVRSIGASTKMVSTGTFLYYSDGSNLYRSSDLVTWATVTGLTGTIRDLSTDGSSCYVATTTNVFAVGTALSAAAVTSAAAPAGGYDTVAFVSNRLLAGASNEFYEIKTGTKDLVYTHFQDAFRWSVIFGVGSRIYVGGFAGNRSELYSLTTTDVGDLVRSAEAASFFSGELLQTALSYGGSVLLGTSEGLRFATLAGDGNLQYGPLIEAPGEVVDIAAQGRFAWFTWKSFPGGGSGVGRIALDQFVKALAPAYATDVYTEATSGGAVGVARFNNRTVFAVESMALYVESLTEFLTEGSLSSGDITFGTVEPKSVSGIRVTHSKLEEGESVRVDVVDGNLNALAGGTSNVSNTVRLDIDATDDTADRATVTIELRGDGTSTPCVNEWRLRAYPVAPGIEEWLVPLIIHSRVTVGDGQGEDLSLDPWTATKRIRDLWQQSKVVRYIEGDHAFNVRIDNFQIDAAEWRDGSDWFEVTCTVRLLSV